ncbi:MAG TPA: putative metal-binding motif-containing protein, partial [Myxococcota bacterium]|nr:putative metal-binding motif-containing protein [Myxococcota bacterium]
HTGPGCNCHESDCDHGNANVWVSCATCRDPDHDGAFAGCDAYTTVDEDCDERDPLIHPGAVDFPDNGIAEDCDGASEPHAADGVGIYVSSDCGSNEQGTMSAPFCTLTGALAASQQGSFIFVASGQYAMPDTVSSTRIFGGYLAGWTSRSPSRTATSFTNATEFSGAVLDDVLIQHAIYFHTNDCNNCAALTVGNGGARLADFDVAMENTATDCSTVQVSTGDAVLVRVTVRGASCVNHRAVVQNDRDTVVWKSQIQAGSPGNVTQQPTVFWGGGGLTVGESTLAADGARATAIQTFSGAVVDLQSVRIDVEGVDGISGGVAHEGSSLRVVNSLLEVTSTAGTAFPLTVGSGMADIFHTNIEGTGVGATAVQIATTGVVRVINDVLTAVGSAGSYGLNIPNPGSQVSVVTNDFQVSGGGTTCAMLVEGICGDPIGVDGNIQSTGCELPLSTSCTRILAGTGLDDELTPRVDIDYATRFGWDIGAYDLPGPTID